MISLLTKLLQVSRQFCTMGFLDSAFKAGTKAGIKAGIKAGSILVNIDTDDKDVAKEICSVVKCCIVAGTTVIVIGTVCGSICIACYLSSRKSPICKGDGKIDEQEKNGTEK